MKVAVVILNWNGRQHLEQFLPSVVKYSSDAQIILADNGSTDDSVVFVEQNFPSVDVIKLPENLGFAGGYNEALKQVTADVFVLLNSDVEVTLNWLVSPITRLQDSKIAACQPKILAYSDKSRFEHAGAAGGFIDKDGFPFCRGRIFEEAEVDAGQYDNSTEVFWATGACLFIKSEIFHSSGGFDEAFFAHMEEIDLCWRIKHMGYEVWAQTDSTVYHLGGGTLNYMSPKKTYLNFRNNLFMIHKNYHGFIFPKMFRRLTLDGVAAWKFLFGFQFKHFWQVMKAHFHYYMHLPTLRKQRREILRNSKTKKVSRIYHRSIVWDYFVRKLKNYSALPEEIK